ncbi:hypothetical protein SFRURICE_004674 [Spodoptera frugiperda]|nr:hypothetical protein SFRURICE_004674 [Spodoptera frugiperda]
MIRPTYFLFRRYKVLELSASGMGRGSGFDPFDPRLLSIKLDVVFSLNGLEVSPLSHCIIGCPDIR